ncbi:sugar ABC transporter ATP-binding protein [Microbacterium sp.]|uniref:sugar ABC transporter ATP-binding protein n=1 Tax=Microbacterium sp. TaxID=51671 RepID=UPI003A8E6BF9
MPPLHPQDATAARPRDSVPLLRLSDISVQYPGVRALDHVSLDIHAGQCLALMGRNGAGKSTAVRIISGVEEPTTGRLELDGEAVRFTSPTAARDRGIFTVHQELAIVPGLSVAENIMLGRWPVNRTGGIARREMHRQAQEALDLLGERMDLDANAGTQSIASQQLMEIARGLVGDTRLLILDEPTSSLTAHEVDALLALVRRLVEQSIAVIYVSHRMNEISRVADTVTVVRDGRIVDSLSIEEATVPVVTAAMVGEDFQTIDENMPVWQSDPTQPVVLRLDGVGDGNRIHDISLEVRRGEIVGLAGLLASGRTETLETVSGARPMKQGRITINGRPATRLTPKRALRRGVALVPEDRKKDGLVLGLSVEENVAMSSLSRLSIGGIIRTRARRRVAEKMREELEIKVTDVEVEVGTLSGGNQQKAVIGRALAAGCNVYLFDEPTRGVDIRAKHQIYDVIRRLANEGNAVIFASSEYEELLLLSNRIEILGSGVSRPAPPVAELTLESLLTEIFKETTP